MPAEIASGTHIWFVDPEYGENVYEGIVHEKYSTGRYMVSVLNCADYCTIGLWRSQMYETEAEAQRAQEREAK